MFTSEKKHHNFFRENAVLFCLRTAGEKLNVKKGLAPHSKRPQEPDNPLIATGGLEILLVLERKKRMDSRMWHYAMSRVVEPAKT